VSLDEVRVWGNNASVTTNPIGVSVDGSSVKLFRPDLEYFAVALKTTGTGTAVDVFSPYIESSCYNYDHDITIGTDNIYGGIMLGTYTGCNGLYDVNVETNGLAVFGTYFYAPGYSTSVYNVASGVSPPAMVSLGGINLLIAGGTSATPNCAYSTNYSTATATGGTFTVNAPTGCQPFDGQSLKLHIKYTNAQTYSWNAAFVGGTTALPTTSSGSSKGDWVAFLYDSINSKWDYVATATGF
jgi:hypothetical protein